MTTRSFAALAHGTAKVSFEEGFQCRGAGADDGQVTLDSRPEPESVADPGLVPGFVSGTPYVDCANDARDADPSGVSKLIS